MESCRIFKLEDPPSPSKITQLRKLCDGWVQLYGGLGGAYFYEELLRGADGTMTGFAFPEILVGIYERFRAGQRAGLQRRDGGVTVRVLTMTRIIGVFPAGNWISGG